MGPSLTRLRRRPRFTIVELLIVIAIIVILVALLLPLLGSTRRLTNRISCMTHMRQLGIATNLYCADSDT